MLLQHLNNDNKCFTIYNLLFLVISLLETKFLRIFGNFREFLENFAFVWEIPERILDDFRELCS